MNTTEIRELNVAELDLVSGGSRIARELPPLASRSRRNQAQG